jgi:5-formyltetrahydrofolate cyclo-ligase
MDAALNAQKAALRKQIHTVLLKIPPAARITASAQICARLKEQEFWKNAATVLFFAPLTGEVDLWPLLEEALAAEKTVALPRFDAAEQSYVACRVQNLRTEIAAGQFGIREPRSGCVEIPFGRLDLILVPGAAFDLHGNRLGRGNGFYDRILTEVRGVKCGIAFDEQIAGEIPVANLDMPMDFILTPARCAKIAE